jgi:hypothetical protein
MPLEQILLALLAVINIFTFLVMANDKRKSIAGGNYVMDWQGRFLKLCLAWICILSAVPLSLAATK